MQVAYNQAMASCSWEQAWACFNAMRRAGVQPNTRSYNAVRSLALISQLCRSRRIIAFISTASISSLSVQITYLRLFFFLAACS